MVVIYTKRVTNRLKYIFKYIFFEYLGLEVSFNIEPRKGDLLISYGPSSIKDSDLHFYAIDLLFEDFIRETTFSYEYGEMIPPAFKQKETKEGVLDYDPFAFCFFMLSRYEEYQNHNKDEHNRFSAKECIMFKSGFLKEPVVEIVIGQIKNKIALIRPDVVFKRFSFNIRPTFDIDVPFAFKGRGIKTPFLFLKDLLVGNVKGFRDRFKVLFCGTKDPYDNFEWILEQLEHLKLENTIFFVLTSNKGGKNNPVGLNNADFIERIRSLSRKGIIGLHPSYESGESVRVLESEKQKLENLLFQENIYFSRQHFLKLTFPETYEQLIDIGITEDCSMAFSEEPGFRAGISRPFYWFNLKRDITTNLWVHSFCFMDSTYEYEKGLSEELILKDLKTLKDNIKNVNGIMVINLHNNSFSNYLVSNNWKKIFNKIFYL